MGIFDAINPAKLIKKAVDSAKKAILKPINDAIKPIKDILNTFKRIICFMEAFPHRIRDVRNGVIDITDGIGKQIKATGDAATLAFDNIDDFADAIGLLISTYSECVTKFITHLIPCILFYTLDSILFLLKSIIYLIAWGIIGFFYTFLLGLDNPVDIYLEAFNDLISYIHYPKEIREMCYICKTLKPDVIKNKASNIDRIFKKEIPALFGVGNELIMTGANKINAAATVAIPVKLPNGETTYYPPKHYKIQY